jgi:hypothetical protein
LRDALKLGPLGHALHLQATSRKSSSQYFPELQAISLQRSQRKLSPGSLRLTLPTPLQPHEHLQTTLHLFVHGTFPRPDNGLLNERNIRGILLEVIQMGHEGRQSGLHGCYLLVRHIGDGRVRDMKRQYNYELSTCYTSSQRAQSRNMTNEQKFRSKERSSLSSSSSTHCRRVQRMLRILRPLTRRLSLGRRMSSAVVPPTIQLTPEEARFCDLLDDFAREGRKRITKPAVEVEIPEVECRIAGGWVRDKVCIRSLAVRFADRNIHSFSVCHPQTSISPFRHAPDTLSQLRSPST